MQIKKRGTDPELRVCEGPPENLLALLPAEHLARPQ